jgi:hypothetical protein
MNGNVLQSARLNGSIDVDFVLIVQFARAAGDVQIKLSSSTDCVVRDLVVTCFASGAIIHNARQRWRMCLPRAWRFDHFNVLNEGCHVTGCSNADWLALVDNRVSFHHFWATSSAK